MAKPGLPQGTRDFSSETLRKREFIFQNIREVFRLFGFEPLETPAMENIETLMGKYGEEGDKLIFKILNNGLDRQEKHESARTEFENILQGRSSRGITERALRYDLTIPFARYVAMNHAQLTFPFKRYQVQPVWRADRPQRGRYREFYQCDADVVGSRSLWNEVELALIYHEVFNRLGLNKYELRINSRKILAALAEKCGGEDKLVDITIAIDKLDKIGIDNVKQELHTRGLSHAQVSIIAEYLDISGVNSEKLESLRNLLGNSALANEGLQELEFLLRGFENAVQLPGISKDYLNAKTPELKNVKDSDLFHIPDARMTIDFTLARGLNYYTGIIFEVKAPAEVKIGSIGGGGRYDDLTGLFGVPGIPGVGISFGVDRIYDVMEELKLFPEEVNSGTLALFFNLGEAESAAAFSAMQKLRNAGISCELFHENTKFDKQFRYAEKKRIPYAVIIGSKELETQSCVVKDLRRGVQETVPLDNLPNLLFI